MRRLIVSPDSISEDRIHITDKEDIAYLSVVLRMKEGDILLVSDGAGKGWEAVIDVISRDRTELRVLSARSVPDDENTRVTLYQGLPKGSKMDEIIRKATELGVHKIVPVGTARSIPSPGDISPAKLERWRRIAKEASKQSRRLFVPNVPDVLAFTDTVAGLKEAGYDLILVLFELEEVLTLKKALRDYSAHIPGNNEPGHGEPGHGGPGHGEPGHGGKSSSIAVFIGPEGGFELEEVDWLVREGAVPVTVGDTILRTETAGPAAIAMILYELD